MSRVLTRIVDPIDLSEQDLKWLAVAVISDWSGLGPEVHITRAADGISQLWRVGDGAEGLIVSRMLERPSGAALVVDVMAGKGIFPGKARKIYAELAEFALANHCTRLVGYCIHAKLFKLYQKIAGADSVRSIEFVKELV